MTPEDLARIRFVTARYRGLRGLHAFVWGICMAGYLGFTGFTAGEATSTQDALDSLLFLLMVCLPSAFVQPYLAHYYKTRFGRVGEDDDTGAGPEAVLLIAVAFTVVMVLLEEYASPLLIFAVWGGVHLRIVIRDFPFRLHHLIGAIGAAVVVAAGWNAASLSARAEILAVLSFSLGFALLGLLDHLLLVRTLGPRQQNTGLVAEL
jgi:hypothetical protein